MSILAFPEGIRTWEGSILPFRKGVFEMARDAEMPVVPVTVRGFFDVKSRNNKFWFRPFRTVEVFVGPQIEVEHDDGSEMNAFVFELQCFMLSCFHRGEFPEVRFGATSSTHLAP